MPCVGFEPTIPASERAKKVHTLDGSTTMAGSADSRTKYLISCWLLINVNLSSTNVINAISVIVNKLWRHAVAVKTIPRESAHIPTLKVNMGDSGCTYCSHRDTRQHVIRLGRILQNNSERAFSWVEIHRGYCRIRHSIYSCETEDISAITFITGE
jgi:hypothetical protein